MKTLWGKGLFPAQAVFYYPPIKQYRFEIFLKLLIFMDLVLHNSSQLSNPLVIIEAVLEATAGYNVPIALNANFLQK